MDQTQSALNINGENFDVRLQNPDENSNSEIVLGSDLESDRAEQGSQPDEHTAPGILITKYRFPMGYHADAFYQIAITDYFRLLRPPQGPSEISRQESIPATSSSSVPISLHAFVWDLVDLKCPICHEASPGMKFGTTCKHVSHGVCIFGWFVTFGKEREHLCRAELLPAAPTALEAVVHMLYRDKGMGWCSTPTPAITTTPTSTPTRILTA